MKGPVFINWAVDRSSAGCAHAQTDLGVPIDELCTLGHFEPLSVRARRTRCVQLSRTRVQSKTGRVS